MTDDTGSHHDPLDAVIADYLQQVESGAVPDREALLAAHPELADRLREFFADYDCLDRQAAELRLAGDSNRTADHTERPGDPPRVRYFGDYELLEVVARGGMGMVYKARQVSLNRLVALKMILHAKVATPRDVARFRAEAEAAANLDHPHIVPIYEVGEHEGRQYYAMRFVEGASLAGHPRGDVRSEVRLVTAVARAVHFAHQRGLLHRDIKPSNVLIAGSVSSAVPLVTDFGLAKRLGAAGDLTSTGEVLGTPRYMAPEQAAGRKDLTVAVDVYSLGVLLYERLTGATPFTGDTPLELARQHREDDPPRPSSIRPGLDRDLETVCLKCLEKEPAKRYASAEALADDLDRWLRGEPILARPVGSVGRFTRWCRRNPVVAGLAGAIAASLVAGAAVATYFAVEATHRATAERTERLRAEAAEDDLETALARSMVMPLASVNSVYRQQSQPEVEALWELAQARGERFRTRFLEQAALTPVTSNQLSSRAEGAMLAAVGLDPQRRERAERLLIEAMRAPEKSLRHQADIAWAALWLTEAASPARRECSEVIARGLTAETDDDLRGEWVRRLIDKADSVTSGSRLLMQLLDSPHDGRSQTALHSGIGAAARRLEPADGARVLMRVLKNRLSEFVAERCARDLLFVVEGLGPADAALLRSAAVESLRQTLDRMPNGYHKATLALSLATAAEYLESAEAARACAPAARILTQALETETNDSSLGRIAEGLARVAMHMEPPESQRVLAVAVRQMAASLARKGTPSSYRRDMTRTLLSATERLEPAEAARTHATAARLLTEALEEALANTPGQRGAANTGDLKGWAICLTLVTEPMEPAEATRILATAAQLMTQALEKYPPLVHTDLADGLVAVAERLDPAEAVRVLQPVLEKELQVFAMGRLAKGLAGVAGRLDPAEAARVCTTVAGLLTDCMERNQVFPDDMATGLAAAVAWLGPHEANRVCTRVVRLVTPTFETHLQNDERVRWALFLSALFTRHLDPDVAIRSAQFLTRRIASGGWNKQITAQETLLFTSLEHFLTDTPRHLVRQRAVAAAATAAGGGLGPANALALLPTACEPLPCRLASQDLVDLLKYPTCVGEMRQIILRHLGHRYGRHFATPWDFVRYAEANGLNLDFTTPPQRPVPKLPLLFGS